MTDRIRHLTVTLDRDYRDDDVEGIVAAVSLIKGVSVVETKRVELDQLLAASRIEGDIRVALHEAIENVFVSARRKP